MAKNRNRKSKKNKNKDRGVAMDVCEPTVSDKPEAMDTSEPGAQKPASGGLRGKPKGRPMKRSKNVRKMKAIAKAVASSEKYAEKILKNESKTVRTQSAKLLYD